MKRTAATASLIFLVMGCIGDPVKMRRISVEQIASIDNPDDRFDVDTTALPDEWIDRQWVKQTRYGQATTIRIADGHRVKIKLVPEADTD